MVHISILQIEEKRKKQQEIQKIAMIDDFNMQKQWHYILVQLKTDTKQIERL